MRNRKYSIFFYFCSVLHTYMSRCFLVVVLHYYNYCSMTIIVPTMALGKCCFLIGYDRAVILSVPIVCNTTRTFVEEILSIFSNYKCHIIVMCCKIFHLELTFCHFKGAVKFQEGSGSSNNLSQTLRLR